MKRKKLIHISIILTVGILFFGGICCGQVQAVEDQNTIQEKIENYAKDIDVNQITKEEVLKIYDEISEEYSLQDIADLLEENTKEMEEKGVQKDILEAGIHFIRTTDEKDIRKIIEEDIDFENIKEKVQEGYSPEQIVSSVIEETPDEKKVEMIIKILWANKIVKTVGIVLILLFLYGTIIRWILYQKAGKHGWAAIIPLYRQIVMYQICDLSPWLMLLWFVPIIGWMAMLVVAIMKRFCLAKEFGRGGLFGFGLLILPPIFQAILAFQSNRKKEEEA